MDQSALTNSVSYIDALHSGQPAVNSERLVRAKSDRPTTKKNPKKHQSGSHEAKIGSKKAENYTRSAPKRPQEEPKRDKKANPNHKTKKELNQDDPKTVLDRPRAD